MAVALAMVAPFAPVQAQTLKIVHDFTGGSDGGNPVDGFAMGPTGQFYGTAPSGGDSGNGVVFRVTAKGRETVLHSFAGGADGSAPNGGVILDTNGVLYGTTTAGGASGSGTVFRIKGGKESVLYSFAGGTDGVDPQAGLVMDAAGNLYGTTSAGGISGNGTVFELVKPTKKNGAWKETVLYSFGTGADGATPLSGVNFDAAGNLYGTTSVGGAHGFGTVFQLTPGATWTETVLHSFRNTDDGAYPYAGMISDAAGNLYGAATQGGTAGGGTIFKLKPSKAGWKFSVLYSVPGWGISGSFRNLVFDDAGNIFGTTHCDGDDSAGTVFELSPSGSSWNYTLLYTFTGGSDGQFTISNLGQKDGSLYGTTQYGGANGAGTIYRLTP
ncbi:MAG TPA: choice-of-anchor tandem repeat GloVer-containing protein [Rhizomicrobium sp.]|nr:choice-of-anchor tandem repeat GloVer-containing protein [Rhizomicrobium sp.]